MNWTCPKFGTDGHDELKGARRSKTKLRSNVGMRYLGFQNLSWVVPSIMYCHWSSLSSLYMISLNQNIGRFDLQVRKLFMKRVNSEILLKKHLTNLACLFQCFLRWELWRTLLCFTMLPINIFNNKNHNPKILSHNHFLMFIFTWN